MGVSDNISTVERFYAAGPADDDGGRASFASPAITWHVPGENRVSRDYHGSDEVFRALGEAMQPLDGWEIDVVDVMGNRDMVVATIALRAERYGRALETRGAHVFRMDAEAHIVEAWGFTADQSALDELLDRI